MKLYYVARARNFVDLQNEIQFNLERGWKCQGGVSYDGEAYIQAMVKETKDIYELGKEKPIATVIDSDHKIDTNTGEIICRFN